MMSVAVQMVLVVQGLSIFNLPLGTSVLSKLDCVSICYYNSTCLSIFYDSTTNMCYLADAEYLETDMNMSSSSMQYLIWESGCRGSCGDGYTWNQPLNLCYKLYDVMKTWQDAEDQCIQDGGHLIKVDTPLINAFMKQESQIRDQSIWIGGNDKDVEGKWVWADNSTVETTYWNDGQPNNLGNEDCLMVAIYASGKWHDMDCSQENVFVCQMSVTQQLIVC